MQESDNMKPGSSSYMKPCNANFFPCLVCGEVFRKRVGLANHNCCQPKPEDDGGRAAVLETHSVHYDSSGKMEMSESRSSLVLCPWPCDTKQESCAGVSGTAAALPVLCSVTQPSKCDEFDWTSLSVSCGCGQMFADNEKLLEHMHVMHPGVQPIVEPVDDGLSRDHVKVRKKPFTSPFVCNECGRCLVNEKRLEMHRGYHTGERPFMCDQCGASFPLQPSLRVHKVKKQCFPHKPLKGTRVDCEINRRQRERRQKRREQRDAEQLQQPTQPELEQEHKEPKRQSARHEKLKIASQLMSGSKSTTATRPPRSVDDGKCRDSSKSPANKQQNALQTPFVCDECGRCLLNEKRLEMHHGFHTGERPFMCPRCGASFPIQSSLRTHKIKNQCSVRKLKQISTQFIGTNQQKGRKKDQKPTRHQRR